MRHFSAEVLREGEAVMIGIKGITEIPNECHECPFQFKFKDGEADEWYNRRCVIKRRTIEYPRPKWCPLVDIKKMLND